MNARQVVADALADLAASDQVDLWPYPIALDSPVRPAVILASGPVAPWNNACASRVSDVTVWVVGALTTDGAAYDALDAALHLVLDALDAARLNWTTADPRTYRDTHPAFRVTVEGITA